MLHQGIADAYYAGVDRMRATPGVVVLGESDGDADPAQAQAEPVAFTTDVENFLTHRELREEVFGPCTLLISARTTAELEAAARSLAGQLTSTLHGTTEDLADFRDLASIVERKAGRIVLNGFPTGVEVVPAMQHGGPYPATTDSRTTSVGTAAIHRWARPVCYQNFPHEVLPEELRDENARGLLRTVDGVLTRD
jgi:NADP-dependent aldehyde dehydrogenase